MDVFESKTYCPEIVAVDVKIENVASVLKIISVMSQSTSKDLSDLELTDFFLIFHLPTPLVGLSFSDIICSNVPVALIELFTSTSMGLSKSTDTSS